MNKHMFGHMYFIVIAFLLLPPYPTSRAEENKSTKCVQVEVCESPHLPPVSSITEIVADVEEDVWEDCPIRGIRVSANKWGQVFELFEGAEIDRSLKPVVKGGCMRIVSKSDGPCFVAWHNSGGPKLSFSINGVRMVARRVREVDDASTTLNAILVKAARQTDSP